MRPIARRLTSGYVIVGYVVWAGTGVGWLRYTTWCGKWAAMYSRDTETTATVPTTAVHNSVSASPRNLWQSVGPGSCFPGGDWLRLVGGDDRRLSVSQSAIVTHTAVATMAWPLGVPGPERVTRCVDDFNNAEDRGFARAAMQE